jgi:hypothetical protein
MLRSWNKIPHPPLPGFHPLVFTCYETGRQSLVNLSASVVHTVDFSGTISDWH